MKKCSCCNLDINTLSNKCPICDCKLSGVENNNIFPKPKRKKLPIIMKLIFFISVALSIVVVYINFLINHQFTWSTYVVLGLISNYLILFCIFKSHQDTLKLLMRYGFLIVFILFAWFYITKAYILTNIIIPSVCIAELLFADLIAGIIRHKYIGKYIKVIISNILLSLVPVILVIFNLITFDLLVHICLLISVLNILGLIIFSFDDLKTELHKYFNY